jgi:p-hydroxybenzoate 3-monooxygenase
MTSLLHAFPLGPGDTGNVGARMQMAELDYLVNSKAAMTSLAENYVGLGFEE